jgi:hypothetical protein
MNIIQKATDLMKRFEDRGISLDFDSGELVVKVKSRRDGPAFTVREEIEALDGARGALVLRGTFSERVLTKVETDRDLEFDSGEIVVKLKPRRNRESAHDALSGTTFLLREEIETLVGSNLVVRANFPLEG